MATEGETYFLVIHLYDHLPQKGIPCGDQVPLLAQTLLAGPSNSNPLSQLYSAIVPSRTSSPGLNFTVLCAGAPGKPHEESLKTENKQLRMGFRVFLQD